MAEAKVCVASGCTQEAVKGIAFLSLVEGKVSIMGLCQSHIERLEEGDIDVSITAFPGSSWIRGHQRLEIVGIDWREAE